MATVMTMATSRLMTRIVSHTGRRLACPRPGMVRTTKVVTSSSLSAIGSSHAPSVVFWPVQRAMRPSSRSVTPAVTKASSAHPE
jgi:hypothetical protein